MEALRAVSQVHDGIDLRFRGRPPGGRLLIKQFHQRSGDDSSGYREQRDGCGLERSGDLPGRHLSPGAHRRRDCLHDRRTDLRPRG
jgi:hypothetical protein